MDKIEEKLKLNSNGNSGNMVNNNIPNKVGRDSKKTKDSRYSRSPRSRSIEKKYRKKSSSWDKKSKKDKKRSRSRNRSRSKNRRERTRSPSRNKERGRDYDNDKKKRRKSRSKTPDRSKSKNRNKKYSKRDSSSEEKFDKIRKSDKVEKFKSNFSSQPIMNNIELNSKFSDTGPGELKIPDMRKNLFIYNDSYYAYTDFRKNIEW